MRFSLKCSGVAVAAVAAMLTGGCTSKEGAGLRSGHELLGNPRYTAICYSGHRRAVRSVENTPSVEEIMEDLQLLAAMNIRLLRTYNTAEFPHAERVLQAIRKLKEKDPAFEMYVMLGAWIQCRNAYAEETDHTAEDAAWNQKEIDAAIRLADAYPDSVALIAVGNEAMVDWQAHHVSPAVILRWVRVLKAARAEGRLPPQVLITTSDNWAALGGEPRYRNDDLAELLRQIDFVSLHTYAFHDTYYNPALRWGVPPEEEVLPPVDQLTRAIDRAVRLQQAQLRAVADYLRSLGIDKPIHIGETGWAAMDNAQYGEAGTCAAGEYAAKLFYDAVRAWTRDEKRTCFYFEAFDEPWKSGGTDGSEGHFGLFTVDGKARFVLWDLVDAGAFGGLGRDGHPVVKTRGGDEAALRSTIRPPRHYKH